MLENIKVGQATKEQQDYNIKLIKAGNKLMGNLKEHVSNLERGEDAWLNVKGELGESEYARQVEDFILEMTSVCPPVIIRGNKVVEAERVELGDELIWLTIGDGIYTHVNISNELDYYDSVHYKTTTMQSKGKVLNGYAELDNGSVSYREEYKEDIVLDDALKIEKAQVRNLRRRNNVN